MNNSQHVSASYTYNALGKLVLDDMSNWGGVNREALYDGLGRLIADYGDYGRGARAPQAVFNAA